MPALCLEKPTRPLTTLEDLHAATRFASRAPKFVVGTRRLPPLRGVYAAASLAGCCVRLGFVTCITLAIGGPARAQAASGDTLRARIRAYRAQHDTSIVRELRDFVAIPNVAGDTANIRRNAERLRSMLAARGVAARILESPGGGSPAVYGELASPGATKTVVFYAHYDGQPVDTTQWATPPWDPVLRDKPVEAGGQTVSFPAVAGAMQGEWRLYGRSASDDKAPIAAMLTALDALKAAGIRPSVNLKLFFEGEE